MARREKAIFEVRAEDRASRVLREVRGEFRGLDKAASAITFPTFGTLIKGAGLATAATAGLALATAGLVRALAPYNRAINEARSLTGESVATFGDLRKEVLGLSADLGVDPVQQAKALYETLSAGVPRDNAIDFLRTATKGAVAGLTETKVAVDGITTVLNAYNLEASQAERISDVYFATIEKGKTNFEELSSSINLAIKPAANLGVEFEEVFAITAQLTAGGTPTSTAFTQIRSALVALQKPTAEMAKLLKQQGFESGRAAIAAQGFARTLQRLKEEAADDEELVKSLGRVEALGAVLGVSGNQAEAFADKYARVMASAGAASAAFAVNSDNLDNRLQRLKSTFLLAADALDHYVGSLLGAASLSNVAKDGLDGLSNLLQAKLDPLKLEVDTEDLNTAFVETEQRLQRLQEIIKDRPTLRPSILGNTSNQDKETGRLVKEAEGLKELQAAIQKRASILSDEDKTLARSNAALTKLKKEREELIVQFDKLSGDDVFAEGAGFQGAVSNKDSQIAGKERELRALQGITEEQFRASQASIEAAEATKGQVEAQSELNTLLGEFTAASKTKDALAQEELHTQQEKYRVLLEQGKVTQEQFDTWTSLQREKLGLLDEEAKRTGVVNKEAIEAAKELERIKTGKERRAASLLDRAKTDPERLSEDLAEVGRLQSEGFLTEAQGSLIDQRFRADFAASRQEVTSGFDEMAAAAESFRERIKTPLERLQDDIKEVQALTAQGLFSEVESANVVSRLTEQFKAGTAEIGSVWKETMSELGSSFSSFLRGGTEDFGEFVLGILSRAAALKAEDYLFGDNGFFTQLFTGGSSGEKSIFNSLFSFDGGGFTGMGPRSGGTDGFGGFPAILHPNEQVIDLSRNQVASGGGTQIAQTLHIQPGVSQEMIPQILKAAKEGTLAAIRDQGRRGGQRGRSLGF